MPSSDVTPEISYDDGSESWSNESSGDSKPPARKCHPNEVLGSIGDVESGEFESGALPTATMVGTLSHPVGSVRSTSTSSGDRAVAAVINAGNLSSQMAKTEEGDSRKKKAFKTLDGDEPKGCCVGRLKRRVFIGIVLAIAIILALVLTTTISTSKSSAAPAVSGDPPLSDSTGEAVPLPGGGEPVLTNNAKMTTIRNIILFYGVTPTAVLDDRSTPQFAALDWLANVDSASSYQMADDIRVIQRYVLATLFFSTNGNDWTETYEWLSDDHECNWNMEEKDWLLDMTPTMHGVECDDKGFFDFDGKPHVIGIRLDSNNLDGPLPAEISALSSLEGIYLGNNALVGSLDENIFALPKLREIDLAQNDLLGKIPTNLSEGLSKIDLTSNRLVGSIPESIWVLDQLRYLGLGNNPDLTGAISPKISNTNLEYINLSNVDLSGSSLPDSIGALDLIVFEASNCGLTGPLSDIFRNSIQRIQTVDLSENLLTGDIPMSLSGLHMSLSTLNLESNKISGQIPWGLAKNINLNYLGLANNNFNGDVPWQFNLFLNLSTLTLHNNNLSGEIDDKLCFIRTITADCLGDAPEIDCPCCDQ